MSLLPETVAYSNVLPYRGGGDVVMFGKYRASRLLRHLRRLGDTNSFLVRKHTLGSNYGD
jgi:hypothetical protein